jgi:hypothetical protein
VRRSNHLTLGSALKKKGGSVVVLARSVRASPHDAECAGCLGDVHGAEQSVHTQHSIRRRRTAPGIHCGSQCRRTLASDGVTYQSLSGVRWRTLHPFSPAQRGALNDSPSSQKAVLPYGMIRSRGPTLYGGTASSEDYVWDLNARIAAERTEPASARRASRTSRLLPICFAR